MAERLNQTALTGSSLQMAAVLGSTPLAPCSLQGSKDRSKSPPLHGKSKKSKKRKDKDKSRKRDSEKKRERKGEEDGDGLQLKKLYNVTSCPDLSMTSIPHKSTGTDSVKYRHIGELQTLDLFSSSADDLLRSNWSEGVHNFRITARVVPG